MSPAAANGRALESDHLAEIGPEHSVAAYERKPSRQERWRQRHPLAYWAHSATRSAIRRGLLLRPDRCECCGEPGPVEAHHPDHHDPLRVVWLTRRCHKRLHAAARRAG